MAQSVTQYDAGIYAAIQTAKGTAASTLKSALHFISIQKTPRKNKIDGVPGLSLGVYTQKDIGLSFVLDCVAQGRITLDLLPAILFSPMASVASVQDGVDPTVYNHTWTPYTKNQTIKYLSLGIVYGESTAGVGLMSRIVRDARLTNMTINVSNKDAVSFSLGWHGLNEAPSNSETFTAPDSAYHNPVPVNPGVNTFTFPSWFPANYCLHNIRITWNPKSQDSEACLGSGEMNDIVIPEASWELEFEFEYDSNATTVYNQVNYLTATPTAGVSAMKPGLKEGAFSFELASLEEIVPGKPWKFGMNFPSLQWLDAVVHSDQTPNTMTVTAKTFGSDWTLTAQNNQTTMAI